jgi:hypothetical protein
VVTAALTAPAAAPAAAPPAIAGSVRDPVNLSGATAVAVAGHYAYTTAYYAGRLAAIDISNPAQPRIAGESPVATSLTDAVTVNVSGGYAYVVSKNRNLSATSNDDGTGNSLTIVDIHTNPAQPAIVGSVQDPKHLFGAYGVAVSGHYAYVAAQGLLTGQPASPSTSHGAFDVIDVSNPAAPSIVAWIDNGALPAPWTGGNLLDHADSLSISGHDAYVTSSFSDRLTVIDISSPLNPVIVASLLDNTLQAPKGTLEFPVDVVAAGGYAYVADQIVPGRLTVVDISNPANPQVVGSLASAALNGAYRVRVRESNVFVAAAAANSVSEIDVSNPAAPRLAGSVADATRLDHATGLDLDSTGHFVIMASPQLSSEPSTVFPPFPLQAGGPSSTGTVSAINLDPVAVTITPASMPAGLTPRTTADFAFSTNDPTATLSCRFDTQPFRPCTTRTGQHYGSLRIGRHLFTVLAVDPDGSVGGAGYTWTVAPPTPTVAHLRQKARSWREGRTRSPSGQKHPAPIGTVFAFSLNANARVTLTFTLPAPGHRVGRRCEAATSRNRAKPRCTRAVTAGTLVVGGHKGSDRIVFKGRVRGRKTLAPGHYTVTVIATVTGAKASGPKSLTFTILPG